MRNYVRIKEDFETSILSQFDKPKYVVLSYNPAMAGGRDFGDWAFSHCYRVNTSENNPKFAKDCLPPGSKVLFYQRSYIIGGFTVVRYEVINEPQTKSEWKLYKKLTDYPASLYTVEIGDYKEYFYRGHIFYTDFFDGRDFKVLFSNYVAKKMSKQGKINISKDEYYKIIGK